MKVSLYWFPIDDRKLNVQMFVYGNGVCLEMSPITCYTILRFNKYVMEQATKCT